MKWRRLKEEPEPPEEPLFTFPVKYILWDDSRDKVVKTGELLWGYFAEGNTRSVELFDIPGQHSIEFLFDPNLIRRMVIDYANSVDGRDVQ